jgi:hypothetical protein
LGKVELPMVQTHSQVAIAAQLQLGMPLVVVVVPLNKE